VVADKLALGTRFEVEEVLGPRASALQGNAARGKVRVGGGVCEGKTCGHRAAPARRDGTERPRCESARREGEPRCEKGRGAADHGACLLGRCKGREGATTLRWDGMRIN
jgi:hypothetical protein